MLNIRLSRPEEATDVIAIWKSSVDATHDFLSTTDRNEIEIEVVSFFSEIPVWVAVDDQDRSLGFMFLDQGHMEALFIDASARGQQVGKQLLQYALSLYPNLSIDVNEQNQQAIGFYHHMGFVIKGRSDLDGQGRAYPILHLRMPD
ncbi:putative acetyltransferase [Acinetobacter calcoaceticus]|uniref:Putative acetyltransferase n=1 Tax=Acinetobacter calcoaceticus TaxID=471 RepID=A0A4R1XZW9_ACICA|nr:putative acetyltransferase [Acinetobacter calcoaceticus]